MSGQRAFQSPSSPAQQPHSGTRRAYTLAQLLGPEMLDMNRRTFFRLRAKGKLPWVQEIEPPAGRLLRFKAEPIDRWFDGRWNQPRAFQSHVRQRAATRPRSSRQESCRP